MEDYYDAKEHVVTVMYKEVPVKISFPGSHMDFGMSAVKLIEQMGFEIVDPYHTEKFHVNEDGVRV